MEKVAPFSCIQPCVNCPYRTDAPVKHWHKEEFKKLLESEGDYFGSVYSCHKNNGSICIGWLIKQDEIGIPSIALRLLLSKNNITRKYMDKLHSPSLLYKTLKLMIKANFPSLLKIK